MSLSRCVSLLASWMFSGCVCVAAVPASRAAAAGGSFEVTIPIVFEMPGANAAALEAAKCSGFTTPLAPQTGGVSIPPGATGEQLYAMSAQTRNTAQAIAYLEAAAAKGYPRAEGALGYDLLHGVGMARNPQRGRALAEKAAAAGERVSQEDLGEIFETGLYGVRADPARAIGYFKQASAQRMAIASYHLGLDYEIGRGVEHNRALAVQYLKSAAAQGQAVAGNTARFLQTTRVAQFHSIEQIDAAMSPPQHERTAQECGGNPNYPAGYGGSLNIARYCQTHVGCPYQVNGVQNRCVRPMVEAVPGINY